jgi:hypothetical protein
MALLAYAVYASMYAAIHCDELLKLGREGEIRLPNMTMLFLSIGAGPSMLLALAAAMSPLAFAFLLKSGKKLFVITLTLAFISLLLTSFVYLSIKLPLDRIEENIRATP